MRRKQQARLASGDPFDHSDAREHAIEFLKIGAFDFRDEVERPVGAVQRMDLRQAAQRLRDATGALAGDFDHHDRADPVGRRPDFSAER